MHVDSESDLHGWSRLSQELLEKQGKLTLYFTLYININKKFWRLHNRILKIVEIVQI